MNCIWMVFRRIAGHVGVARAMFQAPKELETLRPAPSRNHGAPRRTRTADHLFTKQVLYQLSYWGLTERLNGQRQACKAESERDLVTFTGIWRPPPLLSGVTISDRRTPVEPDPPNIAVHAVPGSLPAPGN